MERLRRIVQRISYLACFIGMLFVLPLMFLTTGDVVSRSLFNKPLPGTIELSEYMLSVIILLGAAYTQQVKGHVGVKFFLERCSLKKRERIEIFTLFASLFIITIVVWQGFIQGIQERTVSDMLRIPQKPFRLLVAIGGFLLWMELLMEVLFLIKKLRVRND